MYIFLLQCSNIVNFITLDWLSTHIQYRERGRRVKILYILFIYKPLKMRQRKAIFTTHTHTQQVLMPDTHFLTEKKKYIKRQTIKILRYPKRHTAVL